VHIASREEIVCYLHPQVIGVVLPFSLAGHERDMKFAPEYAPIEQNR